MPFFKFKGAQGVIWLTLDRKGKLLPSQFAPWKPAGKVKVGE